MTIYHRYADDPDAHITVGITDRNDQTLDFEPVVVAHRSGEAIDVPATWEGDPGPQRDLTVLLAGAGIPLRVYYDLILRVPGDNDIRIGAVRMDSLSST